jgi:hypothetical protein
MPPLSPPVHSIGRRRRLHVPPLLSIDRHRRYFTTAAAAANVHPPSPPLPPLPPLLYIRRRRRRRCRRYITSAAAAAAATLHQPPTLHLNNSGGGGWVAGHRAWAVRHVAAGVGVAVQRIFLLAEVGACTAAAATGQVSSAFCSSPATQKALFADSLKLGVLVG